MSRARAGRSARGETSGAKRRSRLDVMGGGRRLPQGGLERVEHLERVFPIGGERRENAERFRFGHSTSSGIDADAEEIDIGRLVGGRLGRRRRIGFRWEGRPPDGRREPEHVRQGARAKRRDGERVVRVDVGVDGVDGDARVDVVEGLGRERRAPYRALERRLFVELRDVVRDGEGKRVAHERRERIARVSADRGPTVHRCDDVRRLRDAPHREEQRAERDRLKLRWGRNGDRVAAGDVSAAERDGEHVMRRLLEGLLHRRERIVARRALRLDVWRLCRNGAPDLRRDRQRGGDRRFARLGLLRVAGSADAGDDGRLRRRVTAPRSFREDDEAEDDEEEERARETHGAWRVAGSRHGGSVRASPRSSRRGRPGA